MDSGLEQYKAKRLVWIDWLKGDNRNSIRNQLCTLLWDSALRRSISKAVSIAPKDEDGQEQLCSALLDGLLRWHLSSQSLAIRRLIDKNPERRPDREVYSLRRLIQDILDNHQLVTRENFLAAEGLEYDPSVVRQKFIEWEKEQPISKPHWVPNDLDSWNITERHIFFDNLAGVTGQDRKPTDLISSRLLTRLLGRLDDCKDIRIHVDKFVAHASSHESHGNLDTKILGINLRQLSEAEMLLAQVYSLLLVFLRNASGSLVPLGLDMELYYIDKPLARSEDVDQILKSVHDFEKEADSWNEWDWASLA